MRPPKLTNKEINEALKSLNKGMNPNAPLEVGTFNIWKAFKELKTARTKIKNLEKSLEKVNKVLDELPL